MPLRLDCFDRTDQALKGFKPPALLHQLERSIPMLGRFKNEVGQRPPMQIVQVEVTVKAGAALVGNDTFNEITLPFSRFSERTGSVASSSIHQTG